MEGGLVRLGRGRAGWLAGLIVLLLCRAETAHANEDQRLLDAAERQARAVARVLITQDVDINASKQGGETALH